MTDLRPGTRYVNNFKKIIPTGKLGEQTCYYCTHVPLNAHDSTLGIILFTISITINCIAIDAQTIDAYFRKILAYSTRSRISTYR